MTQTDKTALAGRLNGIGLVTPVLAEGQDGQLDAVRDIETVTNELRDEQRKGGEAIIAIGQRLIEAKSLLEHGEWLNWLNEKAGYSERMAQNFMRVSREYSNPQLVADLGVRKALSLLALPSSEREDFVAEKNVIDMTSRELERAIRERDEARRAAEQAQADARAAAGARAAMEESLKEANELLNRSRTDVQLAHDAAADLEQQLAELKAAPVEVAIAEVDQQALDRARAEGEAAKAEEIARLQAQLDKAQDSKKNADDQRREAEARANILKLQLAEVEKAQAQAAAMADPDVAKFEVYFNQAQEVVNKMRGLLLKARGREDQATAEKLCKAILALSDAVKGAAQ